MIREDKVALVSRMVNDSKRDIPFFDDLVGFFEESPLTFPGVDIFCWGPLRSVSRAAALVNVLLMMRDVNERFPIPRIVVIVPATSSQPLEKLETELRQRVLDLFTRLYGDGVASQRTLISELLQVVRCPTFGVEAAVDLIEDVEPFSVVLIFEAAKYRDSQVEIEETGKGTVRIPEDTWVRHLQSFANRSVRAASERTSYVILDAGEHSPYKPENAEILRSVEGCGVLGSRNAQDQRELIVTNLDRWATEVRSGMLGQAFSGIDALPESLGAEKRMLKIQLLSEVTFPEQMLELLRGEIAEIAEVDPSVLVRFSRYAQMAGDRELASQFLTQAAPGLSSLEELELALLMCSEIDDADLEDICSQRLEKFFPKSLQLYRSRVARAINSREYAEAAETASDPASGFSPDTADFYKELVRLQGLQPNYDSILATARVRWPGLFEQGLTICASEARARECPEDALRLLLNHAAGSCDSRRVARSYLRSVEQLLIGRASDAGATVEDLVDKALLEVIRYLSCNPQDGVTRGDLITILSPAISGTRGLVRLAAAALELFHHGVEIRSCAARAESSIAAQNLPEILEPVIAWLARRSPVAIGRCKLPAGLLTVPAETLIRPLERLIQSEAEGVGPSADHRAFETILFASVLIGQSSSNPCDDLHLLHLGAGKLARSGRVQRARDLAETGLQAAGESSDRARMAWYVFADVYQRIQNPFEALVGMACTFAGNVAITAEQAWYETYLLI